uniref:50S ribosomal protein 5ic isoform X1 n=1 Tax=Rhizophora mucronata TaxID=61149 RepID=A0A2P2KPF9_RHIMU
MTVYGNSFYLCSLAYPQQTQKCYNPKVVHFPFSSTSSSCPSLTFPAFACPVFRILLKPIELEAKLSNRVSFENLSFVGNKTSSFIGKASSEVDGAGPAEGSKLPVKEEAVPI